MTPFRPLTFMLVSLLAQTAPPPNTPAPAQSAVDNATAPSVASGALRPPVLVSQVDPEFSEKARKKKVSGNVEVSLVVDTNGIPQEVTVVHGIGMGLDEKAVEAVRQYRFRPATQDGHPVPMKLRVNVNFQIF